MPSALAHRLPTAADKQRFSITRRGAPVPDSPDLRRILALPLREPQPPTIDVSNLYRRERSAKEGPCPCPVDSLGQKQCYETLWPVQNWALKEAPEAGGLVGLIGVGHGKTALDILMPLAMQSEKTVLLLPSKLVAQFHRDYELWRQHWKVPNISGGRWFTPKMPVVHIIPYSILSRPESSDLLEQIQPDLFVADEMHKLSDVSTSTASRVLRWYENHPDTRFCGWTGSATKKSILDASHLGVMALGDGAPWPTSRSVAYSWSLALDPSDNRAPDGALRKLCQGNEDSRVGFERRKSWTLGVITTDRPSIDVPLKVHERKVGTLPLSVLAALRKLRQQWTNPDETETFMERVEVAACAKELACGFFYRWKWVNGETPEMIDRWLRARKLYNAERRVMLEDRQVFLDSPDLLDDAARRYWQPGSVPDTTLDGRELPTWASRYAQEWWTVKDTCMPVTEAIWIDDFLVRNAAEWLAEHGGVVWVSHVAFGAALSALTNLPYYQGGDKAAELIDKEDGSRGIIASISAHGTGRRLEKFSKMLVVDWPVGPDVCEQMLGRLHRTGQKAAAVETWVYRHTAETAKSFDDSRKKAAFVEVTDRLSQKILHAEYSFAVR